MSNKWRQRFIKVFLTFFILQSAVLPLTPLALVYAQEASSPLPSPTPDFVESQNTEQIENQNIEPSSVLESSQFFTSSAISSGTLTTGASAAIPQRYRSFYAGAFSGTGSYSFPIALPPATNDFSPKVEISYSSGAKNQKNSLIGNGWNVSEYSITRDINFTAGTTTDDEFELSLPDGNYHLIYDSANQKWVTERKSHIKIEKVGGASNDYGESWLITTPNGTKHYYGNSAGSETTCAGKNYVHKWYLEKSADIHGNEIFYTYTEEVNTATYLTKIEYNSDKTRTVHFNYQSRNDYPTNHLDQGCLKIYYKRLASIETKTDNTTVKTYQLAYTYSNNDLSSLLSSVIELGSDGSALPATTFSYQNEHFAWSNSKHTTSGINESPSLANSDITVADVNGDSRVDIIKSENNGDWKVWLGTNTGWQTNYQIWLHNDDWTVQSGALSIMDMNGDGLADLVRKFSSTEIEVALNSGGQSWNNNTIGLWHNYGWDVTDSKNGFADMNGDGLVDAFRTIGNQLKVRLNNGTNNFANEQTWATSGIPDLDTYPERVQMIDVTGDGLADLVQAKKLGSTQIDYKVWVNRGDRMDTSSRDWMIDHHESWSLDNASTQILDVNGDGYNDLVSVQSGGNWKVIVNDGQSFDKTSESTWSANGNINYYLSQPETFATDLNGDGTVDIGRSEGGTYYQWDNLNQKANLLTSITTPYGAKTTISYVKAQDLDNTGADSINDLRFPMWVVSQASTNNQLAGEHNVATATTYTYQDGYYDHGEKEFRGFGQVTITNTQGTKTITKYHQDSARLGLPYGTEVRDSNNTLFNKTENTYSTTSSNGVFHSQLTSQKQYLYDGDEQNPKVTQQDFQYDQYDNPTRVHEYGDIASNLDDRFIYTEYAYNPTLNLVTGLAKQTSLRDANDSTKLSEVFYYYDGNTQLNDAPTKGLITKQENWLDGGSNPATLYEYDSYGNQIKVTDPLGRESTTSYDATRHTLVTSVTNPLNQTTTTVFDPGTGQLLSSTDSNSYTTTYEYDSFGRIIKEILPYDSNQYPTKQYTYSYQAGLPYAVKVEQRIEPLTNQTLEAVTFSDGFGNTLQTKTEGTETAQFITTDTFYNNEGRAYKISNPYATSTSGYSTPNTAIAATTSTFDAVGRVVETTLPDNSTAQTTYNKWQTTHTDPTNKTIDRFVDARGNIVQIDEHNQGSTYTTAYAYTGRGELVLITDNAANTFEWDYDSLGRKTSYTNPANKTTTYNYDAADQLTSETDPNTTTIDHEYDALGRVTKIDYPTQSDALFTYDTNQKGTLTSKTIGDISYHYLYDQRYRKTSESTSIDGHTETTNYTYNSLDLPKTIASSLTGKTQTFSFANNGEITGIAGVISAITYNVFGKITGKTMANGATTTYDYDEISSRLLRITTQASGATVQDLGYRYDPSGNITSIIDNTTNVTKVFSYDDLHRLVRMNQTDNQTSVAYAYSYDSLGNMVTAADQSGSQLNYSYAENNYGPHQMTSISAVAASLNKAPAFTSNPIKTADEGTTYTYQVSATDPEASAVSFTLVAGPDGMSITQSNQLTWQIGATDAGEYLVLVEAADQSGNTSQQGYYLVVGDVNLAPEITSAAITVAEIGQEYSYQVVATDPDQDQLTYSLSQSPPTMAINSQTGLLSWTPSLADSGDHTVTVVVSDGTASDTQTYTLTAAQFGEAIITLPAVDAAGYISDFVKDANYQGADITLGERNDQTNQKKRFLTKFDLSSLHNKTILSAKLRVYVNDDRSNNARTAKVYRVKQPWLGSQVTWNSYSTGNAWQTPGATGTNDIDSIELGSRYFTASESLGNYKDFTLDVAKMQEMVNGTSTNNGFLVKMDTEEDDAYRGPHPMDATNGNQLVITYRQSLGQNQPPEITSTAVAEIGANQLYTYQVTATDPEVPEYQTLTYSLTQAPSGMNITSSTGLISWTPTTNEIGDHTITVQVSDGGLVDTQTYTLTVFEVISGTITLTPVDGTGFIVESSPTTNYGSYNTTLGERNDQGNQKKRYVTRFDLSSLAGKTITEATLKVYINSDFSSNGRTARVYRVKRPWVGSQVTWNSYSTGNNWQTGGATGTNDIDTTELGSRYFTSSESLNAYKEFSLNISKMQEIVDGTFPDDGLLLKMDTEADDAYYGPRSVDETYGNRLVISYTQAAATQSSHNQSLVALSQEQKSTSQPIGDTTLVPAEAYVPHIGFIENMDLRIQLAIIDYLNQGGAIVENNGVYYLVVIAEQKVTTYKITAQELEKIHSFRDAAATSADAMRVDGVTYLLIERGDQSAKIFQWKNENNLARVRKSLEQLTNNQPSLWEQFTNVVSGTIAKINPFDTNDANQEPEMNLLSLPTTTTGSDISNYGTPEANPYTSNHNLNYDDNGSLVSDGIQCYVYSEANKLVQVKNCGTNALVAEYTYNDAGTRVRQKLYDAGTLIKTVYNLSPFTELTVHAADQKQIINYYYFANKELVARDSYEVGVPASQERYYYHADHLGSTTVLTNSLGSIQEGTSYAPYGEVLSGGTASKHQFTGQEYDHATGLNYYQSRYYHPYQRRFAQPDTLIPDAFDPQQLNPYSYVRNNPVKYVDPDGHVLAPALLVAWIAADYGITAYDYYQEQKIINNSQSTPEQIQAAKNTQRDILAYETLMEPDEAFGLSIAGPIDDIVRGSKGVKKLTGELRGGISDVATQLHHLVPWNNKRFLHQDHGLVMESGVDLKKYGSNLLDVANHGGRHAKEYHENVDSILDLYFGKLHRGEYENAKDALNAALGHIQSKIDSGELKLYKNKDVWIPNE